MSETLMIEVQDWRGIGSAAMESYYFHRELAFASHITKKGLTQMERDMLLDAYLGSSMLATSSNATSYS
jgi:hypothetical protein